VVFHALAERPEEDESPRLALEPDGVKAEPSAVSKHDGRSKAYTPDRNAAALSSSQERKKKELSAGKDTGGNEAVASAKMSDDPEARENDQLQNEADAQADMARENSENAFQRLEDMFSIEDSGHTNEMLRMLNDLDEQEGATRKSATDWVQSQDAAKAVQHAVIDSVEAARHVLANDATNINNRIKGTNFRDGRIVNLDLPEVPSEQSVTDGGHTGEKHEGNLSKITPTNVISGERVLVDPEPNTDDQEHGGKIKRVKFKDGNPSFIIELDNGDRLKLGVDDKRVHLVSGLDDDAPPSFTPASNEEKAAAMEKYLSKGKLVKEEHVVIMSLPPTDFGLEDYLYKTGTVDDYRKAKESDELPGEFQVGLDDKSLNKEKLWLRPKHLRLVDDIINRGRRVKVGDLRGKLKRFHPAEGEKPAYYDVEFEHAAVLNDVHVDADQIHTQLGNAEAASME
jgi:hypothetical protein